MLYGNKDQSKCPHKKLFFGSGDYYVICDDCTRTWVKTKPQTDEACAEDCNNAVTGEYRVKEDE